MQNSISQYIEKTLESLPEQLAMNRASITIGIITIILLLCSMIITVNFKYILLSFITNLLMIRFKDLLLSNIIENLYADPKTTASASLILFLTLIFYLKFNKYLEKKLILKKLILKTLPMINIVIIFSLDFAR